MDGKSIATVLNDGTKANKNIDVVKGALGDPVNLSYGAPITSRRDRVTKKLVNYASDARCWKPGRSYARAGDYRILYWRRPGVGRAEPDHPLFVCQRLERRGGR